MRGKNSLIVVEPPSDIFFLLAGKRLDLETVTRDYARAVFARIGSVTGTAKILKVAPSTVRRYLENK